MSKNYHNHRKPVSRKDTGLRTYSCGIPSHHQDTSDLRRAAVHVLTSNDSRTQITGIALGAIAVVGAVTLTALQIVGGSTKA